MDKDRDQPLVVMTRLEWCPTRGKYLTTCFKARAWWLRQKPTGHYSNPWGDWQIMKKYLVETTKADKKWKPPAEPLLAKRPHIAALLTDPWWDDGTPREVCTMTVRVGADSTQININDIPNEQTISTTADTLEDALDTLEDALAAGKNPWRKWKTTGKRK